MVKRGDIYWCDLEGKGHNQSRKRPVVIIQNDIGNRFSPITQAVALTSAMKSKRLPTHVTIQMGEGNLTKTSTALCEQVIGIHIAELKAENYIGHLDDATMLKIGKAICLNLALDSLIA
jgi:mRNA interferase MazF